MDVKLENICLSCNHETIFDCDDECCGFRQKMFLIDFGACVENGQFLENVILHTGAIRGDNIDFSYLPDNIQNKMNKNEYRNDKINPYIDFYSLMHIIQEICFGVIGENNTISIDIEKTKSVKEYLYYKKVEDINAENCLAISSYTKEPFNIKMEDLFKKIEEDHYEEVSYFLFYLLAEKGKKICINKKDSMLAIGGNDIYPKFGEILIIDSLMNFLKTKDILKKAM
jgi:hypothetical protein